MAFLSYLKCTSEVINSAQKIPEGDLWAFGSPKFPTDIVESIMYVLWTDLADGEGHGGWEDESERHFWVCTELLYLRTYKRQYDTESSWSVKHALHGTILRFPAILLSVIVNAKPWQRIVVATALFSRRLWWLKNHRKVSLLISTWTLILLLVRKLYRVFTKHFIWSIEGHFCIFYVMCTCDILFSTHQLTNAKILYWSKHVISSATKLVSNLKGA